MTSVAGAPDPSTASCDYNIWQFIARQILNGGNIATLVQVQAVTNSGAVSPVGFVDVQPLVNQIDGQGNAMSHGVLHHLPYFRMQGGSNAIILDPQVGDIGIAVFADHDISSVSANKAQANPGSYRRFDMADGMYLGGFLNSTPTQYVQFSSSGINITSSTAIVLTAPDIQLNSQTLEIAATASATITTPTFTVNAATLLNGSLSQGAGSAGGTATMLGPLAVTKEVIANGIPLSTHVHGGVQTGSGDTGVPT